MEQEYRPAVIEFEVVGNLNEIPHDLGSFQTADDAKDFMHQNFTYLTSNLTAVRYMDNTEKHRIRQSVCELNEDELPRLQKALDEAEYDLKKAKDAVKAAQEAVNSTINTLRSYGVDIKRGTRPIELDEEFTFKVSYGGKFLYYTFIDNRIKLASISDILEHEKGELYSSSEKNDEFVQRWQKSLSE